MAVGKRLRVTLYVSCLSCYSYQQRIQVYLNGGKELLTYTNRYVNSWYHLPKCLLGCGNFSFLADYWQNATGGCRKNHLSIYGFLLVWLTNPMTCCLRIDVLPQTTNNMTNWINLYDYLRRFRHTMIRKRLNISLHSHFLSCI